MPFPFLKSATTRQYHRQKNCFRDVVSTIVDDLQRQRSITFYPISKRYYGSVYATLNCIDDLNLSARTNLIAGHSGYVHPVLYWIAFAPARKQCRIGLLVTRKNGDFGAISVVCEQALLFGRVKRVSKERASKRRSPNRRACSQVTISVTERRCSAPISKVGSYTSERCSYRKAFRVGTKGYPV